ncbi:MAG: aromatic amino acid lyase [Nanoarchaeota archaeon]|nr:aromatic amino acid lyase [Nanoarchaeota archaeon]
MSYTINGDNLTLDNLVVIARENVEVEADPEALANMQEAHEIYMDALDTQEVYGGNVGVGKEKDRQIWENANMLRTHAAVVSDEPYFDKQDARAIMIARANGLINAHTGGKPTVAMKLVELLNKDVHPVIPQKGAVGLGDINMLPYLGLVMIGEGSVIDNGNIVPSIDILKEKNIKPLAIEPGVELAVLSSNAVTGVGALVIYDLERLLNLGIAAYSLSLEAYHGHTDFLDPEIINLRKSGQRAVSERILDQLKGSYLLTAPERTKIQDELSYRVFPSSMGSVLDAVAYAKDKLLNHLNSSDDNPHVSRSKKKVIPSANFVSYEWVIPYKAVFQALPEVADSAVQIIKNFMYSEKTGLPDNLTLDENLGGLRSLPHTAAELLHDIRALRGAFESDSITGLERGIEDQAPYSLTAVLKSQEAIKHYRELLTVALYTATQAWDLRRGREQSRTLGTGSQKLYDAVRSIVPAYPTDNDISLTPYTKQLSQAIGSGNLQAF